MRNRLALGAILIQIFSPMLSYGSGLQTEYRIGNDFNRLAIYSDNSNFKEVRVWDAAGHLVQINSHLGKFSIEVQPEKIVLRKISKDKVQNLIFKRKKNFYVLSAFSLTKIQSYGFADDSVTVTSTCPKGPQKTQDLAPLAIAVPTSCQSANLTQKFITAATPLTDTQLSVCLATHGLGQASKVIGSLSMFKDISCNPSAAEKSSCSVDNPNRLTPIILGRDFASASNDFASDIMLHELIHENEKDYSQPDDTTCKINEKENTSEESIGYITNCCLHNDGCSKMDAIKLAAAKLKADCGFALNGNIAEQKNILTILGGGNLDGASFDCSGLTKKINSMEKVCAAKIHSKSIDETVVVLSPSKASQASLNPSMANTDVQISEAGQMVPTSSQGVAFGNQFNQVGNGLAFGSGGDDMETEIPNSGGTSGVTINWPTTDGIGNGSKSVWNLVVGGVAGASAYAQTQAVASNTGGDVQTAFGVKTIAIPSVSSNAGGQTTSQPLQATKAAFAQSAPPSHASTTTDSASGVYVVSAASAPASSAATARRGISGATTSGDLSASNSNSASPADVYLTDLQNKIQSGAKGSDTQIRNMLRSRENTLIGFKVQIFFKGESFGTDAPEKKLILDPTTGSLNLPKSKTSATTSSSSP